MLEGASFCHIVHVWIFMYKKSQFSFHWWAHMNLETMYDEKRKFYVQTLQNEWITHITDQQSLKWKQRK